MERSKAAFIARGIDSAKAEKLVRAKFTIKKLKLASAEELKVLGLSSEEIQSLQKGPRPPIPNATLLRLLFENRYQCCVCRDPNKPFIVHHIVEWAKSHSHDISNLAIVCLEHHSKAHSVSTLNQNLDAITLRGLKEEWEQEVKRLDAKSIAASLRGAYQHWAFINEMRLFELAEEHKIDLSSLRHFSRAVGDGILDANGNPLPVSTSSFYKYQGPTILTRYGFMKELLQEVIERIAIDNISDYLDRDVVFPSLFPGDFIFTQGAHVFSPLTDVKKGIGQDCRGSRKANNVEVRFSFDRWAATSSSSMNDWLVGTKRAGSLVQVRDVKREDGRVVVTGTALAIASFTDDLKKRDYATSWVEWHPSNWTSSAWTSEFDDEE